MRRTCLSLCKWSCTYLMRDSESLTFLLFFSLSRSHLHLWICFPWRNEGREQSRIVSVLCTRLGFEKKKKKLLRCYLFLLTITLSQTNVCQAAVRDLNASALSFFFFNGRLLMTLRLCHISFLCDGGKWNTLNRLGGKKRIYCTAAHTGLSWALKLITVLLNK